MSSNDGPFRWRYQGRTGTTATTPCAWMSLPIYPLRRSLFHPYDSAQNTAKVEPTTPKERAMSKNTPNHDETLVWVATSKGPTHTEALKARIAELEEERLQLLRACQFLYYPLMNIWRHGRPAPTLDAPWPTWQGAITMMMSKAQRLRKSRNEYYLRTERYAEMSIQISCLLAGDFKHLAERWPDGLELRAFEVAQRLYPRRTWVLAPFVEPDRLRPSRAAVVDAESPTFLPDWASSPGESLADLKEERGWDSLHLEAELQLNTTQLDGLLDGGLEVTKELAGRLAALTGAPAEFWLVRERQFRYAQRRLAAMNEN